MIKKLNLSNHFLSFLAVILGVFLAFSVDSCADRKKEKRELKEIIISLLDDLENDHKTFMEYQIPKNEEQSKDLEKLIVGVVDVENNSQDELSVNFEVENYSPTSSTYLSTSSSGKINLISDLKIKKELSNYYDILSAESEKKVEVQVEFFINEILPWMIENTNLLDMKTEEFRGQIKLANMLVLYKALIDNKTDQYKRIDAASIELRAMLSKYYEREYN